jgi:orotate phosphoribosyltransferase
LSARKGHFLLESGHHGDLWLDLESLCLRPQRVQIVAAELAEPLSKLEVDAVCGPLVEGAFVALMVALLLNVQFTYSERFARSAEVAFSRLDTGFLRHFARGFGASGWQSSTT